MDLAKSALVTSAAKDDWSRAGKVIDVIFMEELVEDTEFFLSPVQEGSRASRGA